MSSMPPNSAEKDAHDPRCYQVTGGIPDGLPDDLCDCRVWRMLRCPDCGGLNGTERGDT